ncbi:MAG: sensor histidine kinase, partial [Spirochaetales bacterium]|nr:sensor histidine kinase [Spirochaetales bacterium]
PRRRIFKKQDEIDSLFSAFNRTFQKVRIEIHEREMNEKKLIQTVEEKNILISEVHHRVKNNLQIILSLLYLQKNEADNIDDALNGTINRISAMAEVHEQLYNSDDFTRISMYDYLSSLIENISRFSESASIAMISGSNNIEVGLDTAIPLGLIINELILNSLKYAFPAGGGKIEVEILKEKNAYSRIEVRDNGVGIDSDYDKGKQQSLGFQIIESLIGQIGGKIEVISDNGLSVIVSVPG